MVKNEKDIKVTVGNFEDVKKEKKSIKTLQQKERETIEKNREMFIESLGDYFRHLLSYTKIDDLLMIKVADGCALEHFELINVKDIEKVYKTEEEILLFKFLTLQDLTKITDKDYEMQNVSDMKNELENLEIDTENVLLLKLVMGGFNRLRLVGSVRIPKGITEVIIRPEHDEKYFNV